MKVNWGLAEGIVAIAVILIAWGVSVEVRMAQHKTLENLSQRIENIEGLMLPVLVDFKTRQELERRLEERGYRSAIPEPIGHHTHEHEPGKVEPGIVGADPPIVPPTAPAPSQVIIDEEQKIRAEEEVKATDWATEAIQRPKMQMAN